MKLKQANKPKPMGHCKTSAKGKVHNNLCLPQETRKKSNKAIRKGRNEEPQS